MRLNRALKAEFRAAGGKYVGELRPADPMIEHRLVPVSRLISRLAISEYNTKAPLDESAYHPARVTLKLRQHIGAPAKAVVETGESVHVGQLVAEAAEGALSARIHASINGIVDAVDADAVYLRAH